MYILPSSFKISSPQEGVEYVLDLETAVLGKVSAVD